MPVNINKLVAVSKCAADTLVYHVLQARTLAPRVMKFALVTSAASRRRTLAALVLAALCSGLAASSHGANVILNGSFEIPLFGGTTVQQVNENLVPGWDTTATDDFIEIWANGFAGVFAADATQHAELNAFQVSTLFQDVTGIPANAVVGYSFAHRGRQGPDTMALRISDLGTDNAPGGVGPAADTQLFNQPFTTGNQAWVQYSAGSIGPLSLGNDMRFEFISVAATGGNQAIGNFLDNVSFGVGVPEPGSCLLMLCGVVGVFLGSRQR